jgi:hypothetical protein
MAVSFLADGGTVAVITSCSVNIDVMDNFLHRKLCHCPQRDGGSTWILPHEIFITALDPAPYHGSHG